MSWNPHMEVQNINSSYPYNSTGSFIEYFEGLTYQHADYIFDGPSHVQESVFPSTTTSFYKFGLYDSGNISYCDHGHSYEVNNQELCADEYRRAAESSSSMISEQTEAVNIEWEGNANTTSRENPVDCAHSTGKPSPVPGPPATQLVNLSIPKQIHSLHSQGTTTLQHLSTADIY
ncbi:hypothetical protein V6N12_051740 [Hibiscus sabdariffa]|uniref:Uncharacterized protein n=1 Tax=Hibiscus sabdariffa TaxID=183260 RepID=A0ABR2GG76_9ROSI